TAEPARERHRHLRARPHGLARAAPRNPLSPTDTQLTHDPEAERRRKIRSRYAPPRLPACAVPATHSCGHLHVGTRGKARGVAHTAPRARNARAAAQDAVVRRESGRMESARAEITRGAGVRDAARSAGRTTERATRSSSIPIAVTKRRGD